MEHGISGGIEGRRANWSRRGHSNNRRWRRRRRFREQFAAIRQKKHNGEQASDGKTRTKTRESQGNLQENSRRQYTVPDTVTV
jgi:hypothetical protein